MNEKVKVQAKRMSRRQQSDVQSIRSRRAISTSHRHPCFYSLQTNSSARIGCSDLRGYLTIDEDLSWPLVDQTQRLFRRSFHRPSVDLVVIFFSRNRLQLFSQCAESDLAETYHIFTVPTLFRSSIVGSAVIAGLFIDLSSKRRFSFQGWAF
jgi:hypothetical protein